MNRAAFYAWGGPGTIRLLKTKYFSPKIDEDSFLYLYDKPFLEKAKRVFGVTDMFVTYSWGFSDATEKEDRKFIVSRLANFEKINTYAYVQGFNLVYDEFNGKDLWCKNSRGERLLYSKGRAFTCPNNPEAVSIIKQRVEHARNQKFTGVFLDNVLFGLPPLYVTKNETSFFGCSCIYCQRAFKKLVGYSLPLGRKKNKVIGDYLHFRTETIKNVLGQLPISCMNLYDPFWHSAPYYFGYDLNDLKLEYFLIENHRLGKGNSHIKLTLPTFVVSYRNGIGRDSAYSQEDMNWIFSESQKLGYIPCYKATEFKTNSIWHALRIDDYRIPKKIEVNSVPPSDPIRLQNALSYGIQNTVYEFLAPRISENQFLSSVLLHSNAFQKRHVVFS